MAPPFVLTVVADCSTVSINELALAYCAEPGACRKQKPTDTTGLLTGDSPRAGTCDQRRASELRSELGTGEIRSVRRFTWSRNRRRGTETHATEGRSK